MSTAFLQSNTLFYLKDILSSTATGTFRISNDMELGTSIETGGVETFVVFKNGTQIERMSLTMAGGIATIVKRGLQQDGVTENSLLKKSWNDGSIGYITIKPDDFIATDKLDRSGGLRTNMGTAQNIGATNSSTAITVADTSGWTNGASITGTGIPGGTTIVSFVPNTSAVLSANFTGTTGTVSVIVGRMQVTEINTSNNEVKKVIGTGSSISASETIRKRKADGSYEEVPYSFMQNELISPQYKLTGLVAETIVETSNVVVCAPPTYANTGIVPMMFNSNTGAQCTCDASAEFDASRAAWNAFDEYVGTGWSIFNAATQWLRVIFPQKVICTGVIIYASDGTIPTGWKIQGSNDGSAWTDLYTGVANVPTSATTYSFTNTTPYLQYRAYFPTFSTTARIDKLQFNESYTRGANIMYKASANETRFHAKIEGVILGPKEIGDSITGNANNGINVSGFTGLTSDTPYYLSSTNGAVSTTVGNVKSPIGTSKSTSDIILNKFRNVQQTISFNVHPSYYATGTYTGLPIYFYGGDFFYSCAVNGPSSGTHTLKLQYSVNGTSNWIDLTSDTNGAVRTDTLFNVPECYLRSSITNSNTNAAVGISTFTLTL